MSHPRVWQDGDGWRARCGGCNDYGREVWSTDEGEVRLWLAVHTVAERAAAVGVVPPPDIPRLTATT